MRDIKEHEINELRKRIIEYISAITEFKYLKRIERYSKSFYNRKK